MTKERSWWLSFRTRPAIKLPNEGPFRTQGSKPPAPPAPKPYRPPWHERIDDLSPGWAIVICGAVAIGGLVAIAAGIDGIIRAVGPCVHGDVAHGTKASTAPDGTPVQIPTSWCVHYKPGREGETP